MKDCMLKFPVRFRGGKDCESVSAVRALLRDSAEPDLPISCCKRYNNCKPRVAILLCLNLFRYSIVSVTSCLCSTNSLSVGLRWRTSRLRIIAAATEKACSIHRTGPASSTATKDSRSIVLAAARQVRRVKAKAELLKDGPRNLR